MVADVFGALISSFFGSVFSVLRLAFNVVLSGLLIILAFFFVRYRFNPLKLDVQALKQPYIRYKYLDLFRLLLVLCTVLALAAAAALVSNLLFGEIPLLRLFQHRFDVIGTENLHRGGP